MLTAKANFPFLWSYSFIQENQNVGEFRIPWMGRWSRDGRFTLQMIDKTYKVNPPSLFVSALGRAECKMELFENDASLATIDFPAANNSASFLLIFDNRKFKFESTGIGHYVVLDGTSQIGEIKPIKQLGLSRTIELISKLPLVIHAFGFVGTIIPPKVIVDL